MVTAQVRKSIRGERTEKARKRERGRELKRQSVQAKNAPDTTTMKRKARRSNVATDHWRRGSSRSGGGGIKKLL